MFNYVHRHLTSITTTIYVYTSDTSPGETVTVITELPEASLEVTWLKDNVPLSITDEKNKTTNQDYSYQLVIPAVTVGEAGQYKVQGGGFESMVSVHVNG